MDIRHLTLKPWNQSYLLSHHTYQQLLIFLVLYKNLVLPISTSTLHHHRNHEELYVGKDRCRHRSVGTYWYHLKHSIHNSRRLITISFKSLVHGLLPFLWKADAPKDVIRLYHEIMRIEHIRKMDQLRELPRNERYTGHTPNSTE